MDERPIPTKERLAHAMEQALCPVQMIASARAGLYDDFESNLALPTIHLVKDLRTINQHALAQRVIEGEFDATRQEGDAWAASEEGQQTIRELTKGKRRD